jgi:hypothetical protein
MKDAMNNPVLVFVAALAVLWIAARAGAAVRKRQPSMEDDEREDFQILLSATLTLLALIIGFTFSMAISRYDQRKNYEEEEANAIGTEYLRAELLPAETGKTVQALLKNYLALRVKFYATRRGPELGEVNARTAELQTLLWNEVKPAEDAPHTAVTALALAGMNDVLNRQGYTQAAWWNRIPLAAWGLMWAIAACCNFMIGYYLRSGERHGTRLAVMPLVVAVSFFLISDIDSPRGGIIRVSAQNLVSLQQGWSGEKSAIGK